MIWMILKESKSKGKRKKKKTKHIAEKIYLRRKPKYTSK